MLRVRGHDQHRGYHAYKGVWTEKWETFVFCARCNALRVEVEDALEECVRFGGLLDSAADLAADGHTFINWAQPVPTDSPYVVELQARGYQIRNKITGKVVASTRSESAAQNWIKRTSPPPVAATVPGVGTQGQMWPVEALPGGP